MAVHKVNTAPPARICCAVAAHASADAVYPHEWLLSRHACCSLAILYNYKNSYKLSTVSLENYNSPDGMVASGLRRRP